MATPLRKFCFDHMINIKGAQIQVNFRRPSLTTDPSQPEYETTVVGGGDRVGLLGSRAHVLRSYWDFPLSYEV